MAAVLARLAAEGAADTGVGVGEEAVVFVSGGDGVEVVGVSATGEAGVGEFVEQAVVAEEVGGVAGHALGFVDGEGVAVGEVPGVDVGVRHVDRGAVGRSG